MRKFQFIRFGGKVQWVNDSTDTCRIEYNTDNGTCFEEIEVEFELQ